MKNRYQKRLINVLKGMRIHDPASDVYVLVAKKAFEEIRKIGYDAGFQAGLERGQIKENKAERREAGDE